MYSKKLKDLNHNLLLEELMILLRWLHTCEQWTTEGLPGSYYKESLNPYAYYAISFHYLAKVVVYEV